MLQPLRGRILVEVLDDAKRTESGLYLAGKVEEVPHRGLVVSQGAPWRDRRLKEYPWGFSNGHIVHFKRVWDQNKVKNYVLKRDQIFAIEYQDKAYAFADYIIVRKVNEVGDGKIFVPRHFESEVSKQVEYGIVMSIGREDKLGVSIGDKLMFYKSEGLSVRIPLQEELWSLKPRHILSKIN